MPTSFLSLKETNYFSKLICDYLDEKQELRPFYNRFPHLENFGEQLKEKKASFSQENRTVLKNVLQAQYQDIETSKKTADNIITLEDANTFTVVTGHQLNLFTGPLYFLYKITSTINLCKQLAKEYPDNTFVPVYWMATEDHDFEEINFFNFNGKKFQWQGPGTAEQGGAVGVYPTQGLDSVLALFESELGKGVQAQALSELFRKAYIKHDNLTDATRYLANELFSDQGLVIIDAAAIELKRLFIPQMRRELFEPTSQTTVEKTISELNQVDSSYKIQVNPRAINLFYLEKGIRERIIETPSGYEVNNTEISWSQQELEEHLNNCPDRFSPNVMTRPLYQEVILPNLCYIGGGGELAYWLELKRFFNFQEVPFPILLLRNSALIISEKQSTKLEKLNISDRQLFLDKNSFINSKIREISNIDINFSAQKKHLEEQFKSMYQIAEQTDKTFLGAVKAQEVKQLKGLDHLEKRLLKAQKKKLSDQVSRLVALQNELFPNGSLQERSDNFANIYLHYGPSFIKRLLEDLDPLHAEFVVIRI
ncbi:bacillithiol biosynthesis cysteine-adding enzyme BshC [Galbibacter sp.]|uniref:bacillithiol biosynthesis cysteine-adding enzyme BshC n=1 Tax=Galbibacter sp. TaxID=2918471 RepID=UPI003A92EDCC